MKIINKIPFLLYIFLEITIIFYIAKIKLSIIFKIGFFPIRSKHKCTRSLNRLNGLSMVYFVVNICDISFDNINKSFVLFIIFIKRNLSFGSFLLLFSFTCFSIKRLFGYLKFCIWNIK